MKMEQTECSETSAYKIQTPGNYPEERYNIHTNFGKMAYFYPVPLLKNEINNNSEFIPRPKFVNCRNNTG